MGRKVVGEGTGAWLEGKESCIPHASGDVKEDSMYGVGKDNASGKAHVHAWRRMVNCLGFWILWVLGIKWAWAQ